VIAVWHWFLYHFTGASNEGGWVYGLWSGIAGSLTVFAIFPITYAIYRRNKCVSCHRLVLKGGLGKVQGTHYETCHKHTNKEDHAALQKKHALLHPAMHEHLNQGAS
jgi:hypothetical protein